MLSVIKCQPNPTRPLFKTINIVKVYPRGQEERRERQGSADPGSGVPATRPELHCSSHPREPARPPHSGAAKGALSSASFPLVPLSKGAKPSSAPASTHPQARTHAGTHPARAGPRGSAPMPTPRRSPPRPPPPSTQPEPRRGGPALGPRHPYPIPSDSPSPGGSAQADPQQ